MKGVAVLNLDIPAKEEGKEGGSALGSNIGLADKIRCPRWLGLSALNMRGGVLPTVDYHAEIFFLRTRIQNFLELLGKLSRKVDILLAVCRITTPCRRDAKEY